LGKVFWVWKVFEGNEIYEKLQNKELEVYDILPRAFEREYPQN